MQIIELTFSLGGLMLLTAVTFTLTFICLVFLGNKKEKRAKYLTLMLFTGLITTFSFLSFARELSNHINMIFEDTNLALFLMDYPMLIVIGSLSISIIISGRDLAIKWVRTSSLNRAFLAFGRRLGLELKGRDINSYAGCEKR